MSTLDVVASILRSAGSPLTARQIVERAGEALPTTARNRVAVVARDLVRDIYRPGSRFVRVQPGLYTLRELAPGVENSPPRSAGRDRARWTWSAAALARRRARERS